MKNKIFLSWFMLSVLFIGSINAQTKNAHLKFMNISMGETSKTFIEKLKQKGFRHINGAGEITLSGKLFYTKALVDVVESPTSNVISKVIVVFNTERTFDSAYQEYSDFRKALTEKYGKPDDPSKKNIYQPLNKSYREEVEVLKKNEKTYMSTWLMSEGEIILKISSKFVVSMTYYDRVNLDKANKEFKQIIDSEL